jgi:hypothetical protein
MLYRLSYASKLRDRAFSDANLPTDPTQMTGTIFKVTITANGVQPIPYPRSDPRFLFPSQSAFLPAQPGFRLSSWADGAIISASCAL